MSARIFNTLGRTAGYFAGALLAISPASSQPVEEFYKGKNVTLLIGSGVGGGYDTYARLVSRHLGKHIPGNPTVVPQNIIGVASVAAANHLVTVAPKDGTVLAALQREVAMVQIVGKPGPKFKATELVWIGSLTSEPGVCGVATRTGIKTFEEVFHRQIIAGSTGPNALEHYPAMFKNLLGAKYKVVRGYKTSVDIGLAIERGELEGVCQSWASFEKNHRDNLKNGVMIPLVQVALKPHPAMTKLKVPMYSEFITAERAKKMGFTVDEVGEYFNLQLASTLLGRPYAMAAGNPADREKAIIGAFEKMITAAEFNGEANKMRREIDFVPGVDLLKVIKKMAAVPKAKLDKLEDILK
ncbi:MAG: hypothetical protein RLZ98_427 [Pseudomonadota bacterium]|jgi:hypothetical protein